MSEALEQLDTLQDEPHSDLLWEKYMNNNNNNKKVLTNWWDFDQ